MFKEIFHTKYKTRKVGRDACNPIRDGVEVWMTDKPNVTDEKTITLVRDLQQMMTEFGKHITYIF